jgi:predicted secreted acid phosphatase
MGKQLIAVQRFDNVSVAVQETLKVLAATAHNASPSLIRKVGRGVTVATQSLDRPLVVFDIDETLVLENSEPLPEVIQLLKRLRSLDCRIFLVTARHPSARDYTVKELTSVGLTPDLYDDLALCPAKFRTSMNFVGDWKKSQRQAIANRFHMPVLLTVGDQWTDLTNVGSLQEMNRLDEAHGTEHTPWILVRLEDGIGFYGLKLRPPED